MRKSTERTLAKIEEEQRQAMMPKPSDELQCLRDRCAHMRDLLKMGLPALRKMAESVPDLRYVVRLYEDALAVQPISEETIDRIMAQPPGLKGTAEIARLLRSRE